MTAQLRHVFRECLTRGRGRRGARIGRQDVRGSEGGEKKPYFAATRARWAKATARGRGRRARAHLYRRVTRVALDMTDMMLVPRRGTCRGLPRVRTRKGSPFRFERTAGRDADSLAFSRLAAAVTASSFLGANEVPAAATSTRAAARSRSPEGVMAKGSRRGRVAPPARETPSADVDESAPGGGVLGLLLARVRRAQRRTQTRQGGAREQPGGDAEDAR